MPTAETRIVQVSDTHLSAAAGVPPEWEPTRRWINDSRPDLVVHTGDIVLEDPDDAGDRAFARSLMDGLEVPLVAVPGNHDVGFYDEPSERDRRIDVFRQTWGDDRFALDLDGWRVVGADCYLFGADEHDEWLTVSVSDDRPTIVFTHQPVDDHLQDGWEMPQAARQAFWRATHGADARIVATGHRHRSWCSGTSVWCPSLTVPGDPMDDGGATDPRTGFVEHRLGPDGNHRSRVVRPCDLRLGSLLDG